MIVNNPTKMLDLTKDSHIYNKDSWIKLQSNVRKRSRVENRTQQRKTHTQKHPHTDGQISPQEGTNHHKDGRNKQKK